MNLATEKNLVHKLSTQIQVTLQEIENLKNFSEVRFSINDQRNSVTVIQNIAVRT